MKSNSRRTAAFILRKWFADRSFPSELLPDGPDRAFVQDLLYTTLRRLRPLRKALGVLVAKWPKGELEALLYVGAAQILYMPDVPDYAAVSETVAAAKDRRRPGTAKMVNAVLHNLIRRREEIEALVAAGSVAERESFPTPLYRRWEARFGSAEAEALAKWHNTPAETFLAYPDGRFERLERGRRVSEVAGYAEGAFIVQDPATALAVSLMAVQPGEEVLDACAAPGGKAVQLAWRGAKVTACEVNPKRRLVLEETLARTRLAGSAVTVTGDFPARTFAKVLVDAPCSNTGVLRRRPDARWNWTPDHLAALVKMQAEILDRAAPLVAPGGRLVYSTCSNEPEENALQVEAFLARHPDFALERMEENIPVRSQTDGAFAAALTKKNA